MTDQLRLAAIMVLVLSAPGAVGAADPDPSVPLPALGAFPAPERFEAITSRPLFAPNRRPPPIRAAPGPAEATEPPFTLRGVILSDRSGLALLETKATHLKGQPSIIRARAGDRFEGWELLAVQADAVTVAQGGRQLRLPLMKPGAGAAGADTGRRAPRAP